MGRIARFLQLDHLGVVEKAFRVFTLDRVVQSFDVAQPEAAALDVAELRFEVEGDVFLVSVAGGAGQAPLLLDPVVQVLAYGGFAEPVGTADGGAVDLLRFVLRVLLQGESPRRTRRRVPPSPALRSQWKYQVPWPFSRSIGQFAPSMRILGLPPAVSMGVPSSSMAGALQAQCR
ncbi:hypothetical protein ABT071_31315 [Streptomyces sp. NPDC002506]|uniref:hypothetical protein n=1 Tax=Streptomyces sp. NPDC002506 TaxID=3154536 RepID=UPI0033267E7C